MRAPLPPGWRRCRLGEVAEVRTGLAKNSRALPSGISRPYLRVANVQDGYLDLSTVKTIEVDADQAERFELRPGDVLLTEGGDNDKLGRGAVWRGEVPRCLHQNHIFAVRPRTDAILPEYLAALIRSKHGRRHFDTSAKQTTNLASINASQVRSFPVVAPPLDEQRRVTEILSAVQRSLEVCDRLLDTKRRFNRGLMGELLTGKRRFKEFGGESWRDVRMGSIGQEIVQRAGAKAQGEMVLSCSKYDGLVDSLVYFGKQVFGKDRNNYKLVRRGQFAYPSNHIEEGSIGLLRNREVGLVSPIYTVFTVNEEAVPEYLYLVFKSDRYKHLFASNTNASVNRRGSLRWRQFATLRVMLPPVGEQQAIAALAGVLDTELELLESLRSALDRQRRGVAELLLTGKVRIPAEA